MEVSHHRGMVRGHSIAVVIPAFNEESKIVSTVESIPDYVDEIFLIDDASEDATSQRSHQIKSSRLTIIHHQTNQGVGASIVTGYRSALKAGHDVACVMAGDGQMDPADLLPLLEPVLSGRADYAKGNRFQHPDLLKEMPWTRVMGNAMLSLATKVTSGYWHVFDSQCGYTAIHRRALEDLDLGSLYHRYGYPNDLLAQLSSIRMRVVDVCVRPVYGDEWSSGIKLSTVVHPVTTTLLRSWVKRVIGQARRY